jgi:hypothetical protein
MAVKYVTISVTEAAREALGSATLSLMVPAGRRVTTSEVLLAALAIARQNEPEWAERLNPGASRPAEPTADG